MSRSPELLIPSANFLMLSHPPEDITTFQSANLHLKVTKPHWILLHPRETFSCILYILSFLHVHEWEVTCTGFSFFFSPIWYHTKLISCHKVSCTRTGALLSQWRGPCNFCDYIWFFLYFFFGNFPEETPKLKFWAYRNVTVEIPVTNLESLQWFHLANGLVFPSKYLDSYKTREPLFQGITPTAREISWQKHSLWEF